MVRGFWAKEYWLSSRAIIPVLLALCLGVALYMRIALPYDRVFSGDWIKFTGIDAYYHMNLVDNLAHNFPRLMGFNPYFIYPGGTVVGGIYFFDFLLSAVIWIAGLGSPTQHTINIVGVYFPAVLGVLIIIPVYFIGKELFNRWAGVISAFLIAVMPGDFIGRSMLGFTDQHVAEVLFATTAIMFLILAIKSARQRHLTFNHLYKWDWATSARPVIYSLIAGVFLGLYLLTWLGALLFVFIFSTFFVIQFLIEHLKRSSSDYLCLLGSILLLVALIMFLPFSHVNFYSIPLIIAVFIPLVLFGISKVMIVKGIKPSYYPLALFGLGLLGVAIFFAVTPSLFNSMLRTFSLFDPFFNPADVLRTTIEAQPLLFTFVGSPLSIAWGNFTTGFFLSLISLGVLVYLVIKRGEADKTLLVVWSLIMLAAVLGQRRFAYYFAVNVAVLTGYISWHLLRFIALLTEMLSGRIRWLDLKEQMTSSTELSRLTSPESKQAKRKNGGFRRSLNQINVALAAIIIFFMVIFPNLGPARDVASQARFAPSDDWMNALSWLKENSPEPFGDPDFYYEFHSREDFVYPDSAYGVLAWWDYGYWITRIAHRIPAANPSQDPVNTTRVARFFSSQEEDSANEILEDINISYVLIDYQTATTKFHAVATWAGDGPEKFFDFYLVPQEGKLIPFVLFYPEYYRALSTRLYNFNGEEVVPYISWVISYEEEVSREGDIQKLLTSVEQFPTYEEAEAYLLSKNSDKYRIISVDPFISPVPLEPVQSYRLVHSTGGVLQSDVGIIPEVKIFAYIE